MREKVYNYILNKILSGELLPGEIVDRVKLSRELRVSPAPIAQAIDQLTTEGLLETVPRKHTRVRLTRKEDVRGQFAIRLALERQAVSMAHGERMRKSIRHIKELAETVDQWPPKHPSAWPAELAFHQALVDLADCPAVSEAYRRVMRRNYFFALHSAHVDLAGAERPNNQHSLLVERLCSDDPIEADRALQDHLKDDIEALLL
ncbi:MAG: GntR family transcriptional regulator [Phycisphaerae bacterium]|nr:GntR family transcriptional regulator [Phycisphaerae bacterium]